MEHRRPCLATLQNTWTRVYIQHIAVCLMNSSLEVWLNTVLLCAGLSSQLELKPRGNKLICDTHTVTSISYWARHQAQTFSPRGLSPLWKIILSTICVEWNTSNKVFKEGFQAARNKSYFCPVPFCFKGKKQNILTKDGKMNIRNFIYM